MDHLAESLQARIAAATRGDYASVLAPQAEAEAAQLWRRAGRPVPTHVLRDVAWLYWMRAAALPPAEQAVDARVAAQLCMTLSTVDPGSLPPSARSALDALGAGVLGKPEDLPEHLEQIRAPFEGIVFGDGPDMWRLTAGRHVSQAHFGQDRSGLDEAIALYRRAIEQASPLYPRRALCHALLCVALLARFERFGEVRDVEQALSAGRQAVTMLPRHHPDRPTALLYLAEALRISYRRHGRLDDLDEAIELGEEARTSEAAGGADRATLVAVLNNLSIALRARFRHTGGMGDLSRSIELGRVALEWTDPGDRDLPDRLTALGLALRARFEAAGGLTDINDAIHFGRQAVEAAPRHHPEWGMYRFNLGVALRRRFEHAGDRADLDEAVRRARESVAGTPPDHPRRPAYQVSLCNALRLWYQETRNLEHLDEAIMVGEAGLRALPADHADWAMLANNIAAGLWSRALHQGDAAALDVAIGRTRAILQRCPPGHVLRWLVEHNLVGMLRQRHLSTGDLAALDEAVEIGRRLLGSLSPGHSFRAQALLSTAGAMAQRARSNGRPEEIRSAVGLLIEAAQSAAAYTWVRVLAGRRAGQTAAAQGDWRAAADGYASAVALLPLLAFRGLDRAGRERSLEDSMDLAGESAASALAAGRARQAIELLDQGRNILWSQLLDSRTELAALQAAAPHLASALTRVRDGLDVEQSLPTVAEPAPLNKPPAVDRTDESFSDETFEIELKEVILRIFAMAPPVSFIMYSFPATQDADRAATALTAEDPELGLLVARRQAVLETSRNAQEAVLILGGRIGETTLRRAQALLAEVGAKFVAGTAQSNPSANAEDGVS